MAFLLPRQRAMTGQHSSTPPMVTWLGWGLVVRFGSRARLRVRVGVRVGIQVGIGAGDRVGIEVATVTPASCAVPSSTVGTMK